MASGVFWESQKGGCRLINLLFSRLRTSMWVKKLHPSVDSGLASELMAPMLHVDSFPSAYPNRYSYHVLAMFRADLLDGGDDV